MIPVQEQMDILCRGAIEILPAGALEKKLYLCNAGSAKTLLPQTPARRLQCVRGRVLGDHNRQQICL